MLNTRDLCDRYRVCRWSEQQEWCGSKHRALKTTEWPESPKSHGWSHQAGLPPRPHPQLQASRSKSHRGKQSYQMKKQAVKVCWLPFGSMFFCLFLLPPLQRRPTRLQLNSVSFRQRGNLIAVFRRLNFY